MPLPNINITPIPDNDPDAIPALWNTRYSEIDANFAYLLNELWEQQGNADGAGEAMKLAWVVQNAHFEFEQWLDAWKLHDDTVVAVTQGVSGDNSIDVDDTSQLVEGKEYVISNGSHFESIIVADILTATRFLATEDLIHNYTIGASIVGCQWSIAPRMATAVNGQTCFFLPVNVGDDENDKHVIIRREADNDCTLRVYFKDSSHTVWTECASGDVMAIRNRTDFVDVLYTVPGSGLLQLKFVCEEGDDSEVDIELIAVMGSFEEESGSDVTLDDITNAIVAHNGDEESHSDGLDIVDNAIVEHNADPSAHNLDVLFPSIGELIPDIVDRDFSGASHWENVNMDSYDETDDLSLAAIAEDQYCRLPEANAPTDIGEMYTLKMTVDNLVSTFTIKSYNGSQTIGTIDRDGRHAFPFTALTEGGIRIVADSETSAADFDDFSLNESSNWEPIIDFKVDQHDDNESAHSLIQTKIGTDIGTHNTDAGNNAHPGIRNKIATDIATHNESVLAHGDIRSEIDANVSIHNADSSDNAHANIRNKIGTDIASHNGNAAAHPDIRGEIDSDVSAHNSNESAHSSIQTKIGTDIAIHNANAAAHPDIRGEIDSDVSAHNSNESAHSSIQTKIGIDIASHNANSAAHSAIQTLIDTVSKKGGWKTIRTASSYITLEAGDLLLASTASSSWTATLPSSVSIGDVVGIVDLYGMFGSSSLTIGRPSGHTIMGLYENLICDVDNAAFILVYTTNGWRLM